MGLGSAPSPPQTAEKLDFTIISITVPLRGQWKRQSSPLSPCVSEIINTLFFNGRLYVAFAAELSLG